MSHARVELLVVGFPGSRFDGGIVPAIQDLVDRQLIRMIDLVLVEKDRDGTVRTTDLSSVGSELREALAPVMAEVTGEIGEDQLDGIDDALQPGDAAAVLLFEHLWALPFTDAIRACGGEVTFSRHLPADEVDALLDET